MIDVAFAPAVRGMLFVNPCVSGQVRRAGQARRIRHVDRHAQGGQFCQQVVDVRIVLADCASEEVGAWHAVVEVEGGPPGCGREGEGEDGYHVRLDGRVRRRVGIGWRHRYRSNVQIVIQRQVAGFGVQGNSEVLQGRAGRRQRHERRIENRARGEGGGGAEHRHSCRAGEQRVGSAGTCVLGGDLSRHRGSRQAAHI